MTEKNQHGLERTIPKVIAREVRQRCGFGCVVCGNAVFQYDHLDPPFKEAREHSSAGIVLLCGGCHDRKSRGQLSVDTVKRASAKPLCKQAGYSWGAFDLGGNGAPAIWIGNILFVECETLIQINGEAILAIHPPEEEGGPFRLTAQLRDRDGRFIFSIMDNEWKTPTENWDINIAGQKIVIRRALGDLSLVIRTVPPGTLYIERMSMLHRDVRVECVEGIPTRFIVPDGREVSTDGAQIVGAAIGIDLNSDGRLGLGYRARSMVMGSLNCKLPSQSVTSPHALSYGAPGKAGRNEPCPCASGLKFKKCHGTLR